MILLPTVRLRTSVIALLVGTIMVSMLIVGSGILVVMVSRVDREHQAHVANAVEGVADRVETFLGDLEARVELVGSVYGDLRSEARQRMLDRVRGEAFSAIYLMSRDGQVLTASIGGASDVRVRELVGIDLSTYPLFRDAMGHGGTQWSDQHVSAVTGALILGLATPIPDGSGAVVAELRVETLLGISRVGRQIDELDYWIVDSNGEVVVDTKTGAPSHLNLYNLPIVAAGLAGTPLPTRMSFGGRSFQVSAAYSQSLGWLFVGRVPAGLQNPRLREIVTVILVTCVGAVLIGFVLAPFWAQSMVQPIRAVATRAHQIAVGEAPPPWRARSVLELNQLADDLDTMGRSIRQREADLQSLNAELEDRVAHRTDQLMRSNRELLGALEEVDRAKDELVRSEKLAALGRLVAGLAHELNTPIGNGRLAVTGLAEKFRRFRQNVSDGLRRSDLDHFMTGVETSTEIAEKNLQRASELVRTFKQVAADRASSRRRRFQLREVFDEILITLSPTIGRMPIDLTVSVPEDLWMDSYPGALGQVVTNLIDNAIAHGFRDLKSGSITLAATCLDPAEVTIVVRDTGLGMAPDVTGRAFDPFFTTAMGQGGTGLGLFIAHNAVTNLLGGGISVDSQPGQGTCFTLRLPLSAPDHDDPSDLPAAI